MVDSGAFTEIRKFERLPGVVRESIVTHRELEAKPALN